MDGGRPPSGTALKAADPTRRDAPTVTAVVAGSLAGQLMAVRPCPIALDSRRRRGKRKGWWRWGRIELPVQNTFPENFLQAFPANLGVSPLPDPRPAGCRTGYPVVPLGSLTPLTGVGDAAPPLMTPSRPGEVGPRRCSLTKQRERTDGCQLRFARGFTRPASNLGLRFPVHGPCRNLTSPRTKRRQVYQTDAAM